MTDIEWYDPVEKKMAYHETTLEGLRKASEEMAQDAFFILAAHHLTGDAKIGVVHREGNDDFSGAMLDSYVYLKATDEGSDMSPPEAVRAATAIEMGWTTKTGTEVPAIGALAYAKKKAMRHPAKVYATT